AQGLDVRVVDRRRLGRHRPGEAGRKRPLPGHVDLGGPLAEAERPLGQVELGQRWATPTWTSRKRAGAAPWETWATCPGSPLPQFKRPHSRHSELEQTPSSEPQNSGVNPAYEGFLRIRPSR